MKEKFLQDYHSLLVEHRLEEFEQKLSSHFLVYFGKLLPLHFSYLDWLVIKLRPIRKRPKLPLGLNSDYINSQILMDKRSFVSIIQFLNSDITALQNAKINVGGNHILWNSARLVSGTLISESPISNDGGFSETG